MKTHRKDLRVKLSPERLQQLESIASHHPARREQWNEQGEHDNDLQQESLRDYESDGLAGNPPEYEE